MRFDARYRAKTAILRTSVLVLANALIDYESKSRPRKRARTRNDTIKFRTAVEALACNFILLAATGSEAGLAVPRSHAAMWSGPGGSPVYGQHFLDIIDLMAPLGLIREGKRGHRVSDKNKMPSLIWPTMALSNFLPLAPPDWRSIMEIDAESLVVLRDRKVEGKAARLSVKETGDTRKYTRQVQRINAHLLESNIDIVGLDSALLMDRDGHIVAPYRRSLYRVFNNGEWKQGGRLFGGFWMSMTRDDRHRIRIDDEMIAVADYRQLFPRMAYVKAGMPDADCDADLYDVAGDGSSRSGWKKLVNSMLFAMKPLMAWPKNVRPEFPDEMTLPQAREMIFKRHAPIAKFFGIGMGYHLMWLESEMLIAVISKLAAMGITALPLHDAVVVARSKLDLAADTMRKSLR